jgi:THO complex subunit 2
MSTPAPTPATPAAADTPMEDATKPETPTDAKPIPYFHWDYITDEVSKDWTGAGSRSIASRLVELAADKDNEPEISIIFQELIKSALEGRLSPFMVSRFLIECFETAEPVAVASGLDLKRIFIQTVSIFEVNESKDETPDSLVKLLQGLHPRIFSHEYYGLNLETSTLIGLGLVTNQFSKKSVRVTTAMVYKQRKHNLLREETEGFSKLITEFFTASYSSQPLEVVGRTDERVKGLIGAFELDPGRVLDILLDTAACTVVSNARFFVRLLKCSAWWPQQLQHLIEDDTPKSKEEKEREKEEKEAEKERQDREFFDKLGSEGISAFFETLEKGTGNKVAAQLLGFKFRYYQRKDVTETTPENLLVLSALLIKIGFIDLADLYPHLAPHDDEGMTEVLNAWRAKLDEKHRGGKRNALMMAGALVDDTAPLTRNNVRSTVEEKKPEEKKPEAPPEKKEDNQKLFLLKYLLAVGALPEAMFILGKYPWLPGPSDDITEHLARVITQSLDGVYPAHRPPNIPMGSKKVSTALQSSRVAGGIEQFEQPRRKPMVTFTVSNLRLKTGDVEYRFFWEEWKEGVPICREPQHVVVLMETLGRVLGVRIGRDPGVITRVCRIGKDQLRDPNCTEEERSSWIGLARSLLIPAISLTEGNQGIVNEVWKLLECFSTKERYSLYGEWTSVTSKRIPELKNKVAETERETRDLLKRISKTNVKQMARQLAKVATSNPVTVMQVVLGQVEGYDNLIECVVDAARYFTPLGFDAVGFCVLNRYFSSSAAMVQLLTI